jgi:hypothetical protein
MSFDHTTFNCFLNCKSPVTGFAADNDNFITAYRVAGMRPLSKNQNEAENNPVESGFFIWKLLLKNSVGRPSVMKMKNARS